LHSNTLKVTVLGSGTSSGVPVIACDCAVCTSSDPNNQRLRSSIVLRNDQHTVLVDCGSDYRQQALTYHINRLDAVLLTHAHSDHVSGIDEIRLYNWRQKQDIPLYGSADTLENIKRRFDYIFNPGHVGGGIPRVELHEIGGQPFQVLGYPVIPLDALHGKLPVLGFRFGDFGYITDASEVPEETIRRLRGVRYLILNALRHRPHPTHLTVAEAVEITKRIGPERAWFTHITHDLDHETTNAELPKGMNLAHDGLEFTINPSAPMPAISSNPKDGASAGG